MAMHPFPTNTYRLIVKRDAHDDLLWETLYQQGINPLFSEEDEAFKCLYVQSDLPPNQWSIGEVITHVESYALPVIDWEEQWEFHGENYKDGRVHVHLADYCELLSGELSLEPGPGFGDLSHPSTRMALAMLLSDVSGRCIVDIGCGSGILSCAAAKAGANAVFGIDICPEAIIHARKNVEHNGLQEWVTIAHPDDLEELSLQNPLVVMNMILSEQKVAWKSFKNLYKGPCTLITSGILSSERESAKNLYQEWGFSIKDVQEKEDWLAIKIWEDPPLKGWDYLIPYI